MLGGMRETAPYHYPDAGSRWNDDYIWPALERAARAILDKRAFEVGCGNGFTAIRLQKLGFDVTAVDTSDTGIAQAQSAYPECQFRVASAYDDLAGQYGAFPFVFSVEVVEHLMRPAVYARRMFDLLEPGGAALVTTPYHGWLKNVAIAMSGKWDTHHDPLWEGGHIKFWSAKTLTKLLLNAGFTSVQIERVGRIPPLAKSMVAIAVKAKV